MKNPPVVLSGKGEYCQTASVQFEIGQVVGPWPDFCQRFGQTGFLAVLERYRPPHMLSYHGAVVMHTSIDHLDNGAEGEWLHELYVPADVTVQRHDITWANQISLMMVLDPEHAGQTEIRQTAERYWRGEPSDDPVWEYLAAKAIVVACHRFQPL